MMSSQTAQTFADPVFKSKMPLYDGTVTSAGRSKPQNMPGFLSKQALQYSGAYFTFDPRGKDGAGFAPWTGSKTCLPDGRSPASHLSGMEGQNHVIYRQDPDAKSSEERHSRSPSVRHIPGKQVYSYYAGPGTASPTVITPPAVRKQISGGGDSSPPSESSVYLAIPKPIYVHSPCCNAMGCVLGQRYSVERGCQRMPNTVYESEWMPSGAQYAQRRPGAQRKAGPDAALHQRGLHYETNAEQSPLTYCSLSPGRARTLPTYIEPNYSGYPCTPPHAMLGPLSEQSQHLQTSPRGYRSLYPSHPTYEHMTSDVYQAHSPMSKYGPLTQHPMFYYPQASVEVESRTLCKDTGGKKREDVPVILKTPQEHFIPKSHGEIPLRSTETLTNHALMQGFDYSCYAVPRITLSASQIRDSLKKQHVPYSMASNHVDVSPSHQHMAGPLTSANLHKGHFQGGLLFDPPYPSPPFLHMDQPSSSRHLDPPAVSPASMQINRMFSPRGSLHMDRPRPSPVGLNIERLLNCSPCETQVTRLKDPQGFVPEVWPPRSPNRIADSTHRAVTNNANHRKRIYSPVVARGKEHNPAAFSSDTTFLKGSRKRSFGHLSPSVKIKEESENLCESGQSKKRQKVELDVVKVEDESDSPPMPIIDNVFSLAAYKSYLQTPGVLLPVEAHQRNVQSPEPKRPDRDGQRPLVCLSSPKICPNTSAHKSVIQILEPKNIKVEKVDPQDTDNSIETPSLRETDQEDCSKTLVKTEGKETGASDGEPIFVINKCEPDELDSKDSVAVKDETLDVSGRGEQTAETGSESSFQGDARPPQKETDTPQPTPAATLQALESKLSFRNIPPQCLKLSTFNIFLPDGMHSSSVPSQVNPPVLMVDKFKPKFELRKHFLELHQSLCKLISKSVSVSSEQDLRSWLSQLNMTEHTSPSAKVRKVSCLLGAKARETWLNEETNSALQRVLERLREYTAQGRCPFPHVMRTGAVFLPMLVLKELLFPHVQSSFIDQVLQEHKVELRPTTLTEEKILIQLHKRACSSKLRRLMSLKHLPDVYADVVNLSHHASVCKHLGLNTDDFVHREPDEGCEVTNLCRSPAFPDVAASPASGPDPQRSLEDQPTKSQLNDRTKGRTKSSPRRMFLSDTLSDEEEAVCTEKTGNGGIPSTLCDKSCIDHQSEGTENRGSDHMVAEEDSSQKISDDSWTSPLTTDELSSSASDTETEETTIPCSGHQSLGTAKSQDVSKKCSGMILKLRRIIFGEGLNRKKAHYQAVSDSGTITDPCTSQPEEGPGPIRRERSSAGDLHRRTSKAAPQWQRTGTFSHSLRPLCRSSKRQRRSLLKIKYCPYLSACHSAEHRKRWVLRSAVQRARRALRTYYPDLVGKRILHLYEEDDKSEVWYKGEVLGIHEAYPNPLNTIFEVRYDSEPEWKYYLELLIDYEKGWLKIED